MNKKIIIPLLSLLGLISVYFAFFHKSTAIDEFTFNLEDTSKINKILVFNNINKTKLSKSSGQWMVNETYHANQPLIRQLLRVFKNIEINLLVSEGQEDSTIDFLQKKGIRLQFLSDDNIRKEFWIGPFNSENKSTLIMNEDEVSAFVVSPGLSNNISKFIEPDPVFWRDRLVFGILPEAIQQVDLYNFNIPENSFSIKKNGNKFELYTNQKQKIDYNESKLLRYLSYFGNISFESLADSLSGKQQDSVLKQKPIYSLKLTNSNQQTTELLLFSKQNGKNPAETDLNNIFGTINHERLIFIISYFQIDPVLKEVNYFTKE